MRIYLASKRRLVISVAVLAVSAAIFFPATAKADGDNHDEPAKGAPHGHAAVYPSWTEWRSSPLE